MSASRTDASGLVRTGTINVTRSVAVLKKLTEPFSS